MPKILQKNFCSAYFYLHYAVFSPFGKHFAWIFALFFAIMGEKQKICKKHKRVPKKGGGYEVFTFATAWEIFPYGLTYRAARQLGGCFALSLFLSAKTHRRTRLCRKGICAACCLSALPSHHHSIQRIADRKIGNRKRIKIGRPVVALPKYKQRDSFVLSLLLCLLRSLWSVRIAHTRAPLVAEQLGNGNYVKSHFV